MVIGKIVKSDSHINYVCQIFGPHEWEIQPRPADYAFGRFVRVAVRSLPTDETENAWNMFAEEPPATTTYAVGVIYNTILQNPAYGVLGPRLSNETQVEMFSPDYISEKAVLTYILVLGMMEVRTPGDGGQASQEVVTTMQGVPSLSLELDSQVETMSDEEVCNFHYFADPAGGPDSQHPYLHMGYLPHIINQPNSLLPMVTLRIIDQLEQLFPQNQSLLSIVKRNFAWRLKVETTG
ncbi:MAG TPA: hypothetical protein VL461_05335 [Dictyobacter sp.]|jgi:hypothetical protein|nr:hypothetical protein [Dictyobacter sp.]